ncbi:rRNA maturation RNase YbeY [Gemella sp. zg-1178]|uniref:rRNA maturation RNase YbeY n=1 Tax=Gemella sp. zg-1178 TaxID=2840372 RepID=UPI001C04A3B3|nr:rRNA maturation RNase YbeY [Gemella sp. zg-1178]MBU0278541.1 rRNA maturation RNase YbeY [Gemella sp. zg-1178]
MSFVEIIDDSNILEFETKNMLVELLGIAADYENINKSKTEFSLSIVDIEQIHKINKEYRGIDRPTDVISFALNDDVEDELEIIGGEQDNYIGDIIICFEIAKEQAKEYEHSLERELGFLAVHGFLHLLGYDHATKEDEIEMFTKQKEILEKYGLTR